MIDLYIIHGWTYTTKPWDKTLSILKKQHFNIKMLSVPGLTEPSDKVWTIDDYVNWADHNIPTGAIALGHSNGGRILLNLCAKNPKKLKHLILLDSAGIYESSVKKDIVKKLAKFGTHFKKVSLINKIFHKITGSTDYYKAPENMKKTLTNMLESDKSLKLSDITTSTSILWGKKDTVTPIRHANKLNQALTNSTLKVFNSWTHAPYISNPDELATAIAKIIQAQKT